MLQFQFKSCKLRDDSRQQQAKVERHQKSEDFCSVTRGLRENTDSIALWKQNRKHDFVFWILSLEELYLLFMKTIKSFDKWQTSKLILVVIKQIHKYITASISRSQNSSVSGCQQAVWKNLYSGPLQQIWDLCKILNVLLKKMRTLKSFKIFGGEVTKRRGT